MKRALLEQLVEAAAGNGPLVLVRALASGRQCIVDADGPRAGAAALPEKIVAAARTALRQGRTQTAEAGGERYLLQVLAPKPRLVVVGAVHIAQKLIPMAQLAGYEVVLVDPRPAFASGQRFPGIRIVADWPQHVMPSLYLDAGTALVTLSHDAKIDEPALEAALQSEAFYIGALGSRKNHAKRLERLREKGFEEPSLARIAGPIGLPLGGRAPGEIAVAILAQMIRQRYRDAGAEAGTETEAATTGGPAG